MKTVTVYHYRRDLDATRVCDMGCKHSVTFHEVKRLTPAPAEDYQKMVKGLHYTHDGVGTVRVAYDAQGRRYEQMPTWDGPGAWLRQDGKAFFDRPVIRRDVAYTLDNRIIK